MANEGAKIVYSNKFLSIYRKVLAQVNMGVVQ